MLEKRWNQYIILIENFGESMFYRKISKTINDYLENKQAKILCVDGARQVGKSFIIRQCASKKFKNYIEINMSDDKNGEKVFESVGTINDFYIQVSVIAGDKLGTFDDTIIFIDEIQEYPRLLTLLKPLKKIIDLNIFAAVLN